MARRKKPLKKRRRLKSGLEIYCNKALKEAGLDFQYEGESYLLLDGLTYPYIYHTQTAKRPNMTDKTGKYVQPITYTSDFISHKHKFFIETKGVKRPDFMLRWKLFLRYLVDNGMDDYMLFMPKNSKQVDESIKIIKDELRRVK